jgi:hypothetical protein
LYNRNIGAEYNLASSNNAWTGKLMFLKSFTPGKTDNSFTHAANLQYSSRQWLIGWQHEWVGKNYSAEVGYVPAEQLCQTKPLCKLSLLPCKKREFAESWAEILRHLFL